MQLPDVRLEAIRDPATRQIVAELLNAIETLAAENAGLAVPTISACVTRLRASKVSPPSLMSSRLLPLLHLTIPPSVSAAFKPRVASPKRTRC